MTTTRWPPAISPRAWIPSRFGDRYAGGHVVAAVALSPGATLDEEEAELDGKLVYQVKAPAGRHHDSLWAIAERHLGERPLLCA